MTMCVKRAALVWALVLLTTTYFILTCAAPTSTTEPAEEEAITTTTTVEPPAVSTTPPVKSTDEVDSSNNVMTDAPAVSERVPSNDDADGYLYYQIKKCIAGHNLTLGDIQYVLSQKDEEGQFMFALADKLGYMSDGTHNNPHIPVIRSHRENLIKLLEKMAAMKESHSQEHNEGPTVSSNETPASKEPASPSDSKKIGVEVSDAIRKLGPEAIQYILSDLSFSDILGYTVGSKLHYSPEDEHMKYLENANADELKELLQRTLESKTTSKTPPIPPTVKPPNKELVQSTKAPSASTKSEPGHNNSADHTDGVESVISDTSAPGDSDPTPPISEVDQMPDVTVDEGKPPLPKDPFDDEETDPFDRTDYDDGGLELLSRIDKEKRTSLLNSKDFQTYLATEHNELYNKMDEADPNEIDEALEEYLELLSDSERSGVIKDEEGGDDSNKFEAGGGDEPEAKEDFPDQPLDSNDQAKGALDSLVDEDEVEYDRPRSSSSFGALHFLGIFLVLGVVVVVGYLCMHNRKKLREGVATYIKDSSKRRRRAREYKPLIST